MISDGFAAFVRLTVGLMARIGHFFYTFKDSAGVVLYLTNDAIIHLVEAGCLVGRKDLFDRKHVLQQHGLVALGGRQYVVNNEIAHDAALDLQFFDIRLPFDLATAM